MTTCRCSTTRPPIWPASAKTSPTSASSGSSPSCRPTAFRPCRVLDDATDISLSTPGTLALDFTPRILRTDQPTRNTLGPLGYGWTDDWNYSLSVGSDGTVTVTMPIGQQRVFQPDSRGSDYFAQPGDTGILTPAAPAAPLFRKPTADRVLQPNGTLDYIQDTDGDRITAGYTGEPAHQPDIVLRRSRSDDRLQRGRPDPVGHELRRPDRQLRLRRARSPHSVTASDGQVTSYAYDTGTNPAPKRPDVDHDPDGTHQFFTYSAERALAATSQDSGVDQLSFTYNLAR